MSSVAQSLQQFGFDRDLRLVVLQLRAIDQKHVFDPLPERGDFGQLQVDAVACQHAGERVEDTFLIDGPELQHNKAQIAIETELLEALKA